MVGGTGVDRWVGRGGTGAGRWVGRGLFAGFVFGSAARRYNRVNSMTDDAELLHTYATRRDEAAFAELVRRHLGVVYFAAQRRCGGDRHRAEEVTQRVFTLLASEAAKLHRHAVLAGWLYVTTRNVAANLLRDEQSRQEREAEAWAMSEQGQNEAVADWERLRPVLDGVIDELADGERDAILLRYFQNKTFADIGAALGLKEDAARMRVGRALEKLRARLLHRGIASTATALGVALTTQGAMAQPVGLAASVTATALAGGAVATGAGTGVTALSFMSTGKFSITVALALIALLASLGGNAYLLSWSEAVTLGTSRPAAGVVASTGTSAAGAVNPDGLVREGELRPLIERLRAEGASDGAVRSVIEGILRRRYREKLSQDRAARVARGWWKDEQRTWGTAESMQRLIDDPTLVRAMVTDPLERLLGPDPADMAEADAKYSFLPTELRQRLGQIDRALPGGWGNTGDPATDRARSAEFQATRDTLLAERAAVLDSLTPEQRQSYEMRFSRTGTSLAQQLEPLGATEQEFTAVYPLAEQYYKNYENLFRQEYGMQKMNDLDRGMAQQLVATLGYDRALDFIWGGTQEYAPYARIAQESGLPAGTAGRVLQLEAETGQQGATIHADTNLSVEQKVAALAELQKTAREQLDRLFPPVAQQRLAPAMTAWIESLGQGGYKTIQAVLPGRGNMRIIGGVTAVTTSPRAEPPALLVPPRPKGP